MATGAGRTTQHTTPALETTMTDQLALDIPTQPPAPDRWGVVVDEVLLNSLRTAAGAWWAVQSAHFYRSGKLRHLVALPIGGVTEIGPLDLDDAEFARDHLIESGVHPRAVTARRWTEQPHLPGCRKAKPCRLCRTTDSAP
ncbi:hypothetical protein AT728_18970 [Streptomyces silvensis]|uniref:Uncharacterized protein n=1 Tax=Streptomyces silvensis TaxID=1765722 RepID=A0A0W7X6B2_9ACTN|nr:hypothetical protein AT728_18970 [Streptomyces silvensis]